jgi:glyoxalase family protein
VNLDFYTRVLGLRLVKKTVNFDDPGTYHFYFGDALGRPGSILTFFPHPSARKGVHGVGQVTTTAFSVSPQAFDSWRGRLREEGVRIEPVRERFGRPSLVFRDPDGLRLEISEGSFPSVEEETESLWTGPLHSDEALQGLSHAVLSVTDPEPTVRLLCDVFGLDEVEESDDRLRLRSGTSGLGSVVDVERASSSRAGRIAAGTVHHIAWRAADERDQISWRERLLERGYDVTPVLDRKYFRSIYFREPGGILFEVATDPPGFTVDESPESLGCELQLPPWLESSREEIEVALPDVRPE